MALLEILVPSIPERWESCYALIAFISPIKDVTIRTMVTETEKDGGPSTGAKRNQMIEESTADYVWFVDDDDELLIEGVLAVIEGCKSGADVIGYDGYMTTNGMNRHNFEIRLDHPFDAINKNGMVLYRRYPNHITPMKRELIKDIKFPEVSWQEDKQWADKVKEAGVLKTEYIVDQDVYHYKFMTKNKSYAT